MKIQNCPDCKSKLKKVQIKIEDAETKAISYQCPNCDYFIFEPETTLKIIEEIKTKESPLKIKQKIIKLSKDRLGMYFNKDIIESLNLKSGEEILVSVPNKKKVVLDIC
ncbi:hypothetical protein BMS3Abin17_01023 [archaeon BMS3Abin17]|nr:hypothetical protein BMS3Abin17_01023 [archaeon BMS3Abin17]HDZ60783.1 hypothetical protein [Candidatus Pacearchaeota archaeon]